MKNLPEIVVSSFDLERLEDILQAMPAVRRAAFAGLQSELRRARVVEPAAIAPDVVTMNSIVRFTVSGSNVVREARLCFPRDMDGSAGRISVLSPVGTALLGLAEGEQIGWTGPDGNTIQLRVEHLVFQPERGSVKAN